MHTIEPELLKSSPRRLRVHLPDNTPIGLGCISLFLLPFVVVGLGALFYALNLTSIAVFGWSSTGTVVSKRVIEDSEGSDTYRITYRYMVDSRSYIANDNVGQSRFNAIPEGAEVRIKYSPVLPAHHSFLADEFQAGKRLGLLWLWVAIWDGVLFSIGFGVVRSTVLQRRLVESGTPTVGTIIDKTIQSDSESTTYFIHYNYRRPYTSREGITDKRTVTKDDWGTIQTGDSVTVLYLDDSPKHHELYRFCMFRAL